MNGTGNAPPIRIAMWSGPRNLSTAMMRSFGSRRDCSVVDEPYYAAYLHASGADHPMRDAIVAAGETDWRQVEARILGPVPGGARLFYQKHMSHHMLPQFGRTWLARARHAILIRTPERILASYGEKRADAAEADIGMVRLHGIMRDIEAACGVAPPVVEAEDVRADPEGMLRALCAALSIAFDPAMLSWREGRRPTDGVWADHWYGSVEQSTGFAPPSGSEPPTLSKRMLAVAEEARPAYEAMAHHKLRPISDRSGST